MSKSAEQEYQFATFGDRFKAASMDYIGALLLFFVGALIQTPLFWVGAFSIVMGVICQLFGIFALLFINGYAPSLNRGQTPNRRKNGLKIMKIVNKETLELRDLTDNDMAAMLLRAFVGWFELFLPLPLLLPWAIMSSSKYSQRLADMLVNTVEIKVDPVEEVSMKDFRYKKSDPIKEDVTGTIVTKTKETTEVKIAKEETETGINASLFNIGKVILIISSIILMVCFFDFLAADIVRTVDRSLYIFGGGSFDPGAAYTTARVFQIISYIIFFASCAGLLLISVSLEEEHRMLFYISSGLYLVYIILHIIEENVIYNNAAFMGSINFVNLYSMFMPVGALVLNLIEAILIIVMLFLLSSGIKKIKEKWELNIKPYSVQIALIVFICLWFATIITGIAAQPTAVFATVIFYLRALFGYILTIIYLIIFGRLMKLRKLNPT